MTEEQKKQLRQELVEQRASLVAELEVHPPSSESPGPVEDAVDRTERELEQAFDRRIALGDTHLLHKINFALNRMDEGSYELCAHCQHPIGDERLMAKPSVSLCRPCQQAKEDGRLVENPE